MLTKNGFFFFLLIFFMLPNTEKYEKLSLHKVFDQNKRSANVLFWPKNGLTNWDKYFLAQW